MVRGKKSTDSTQSQDAIKGEWECAECGTKITDLPFEPSGNRPIYCKECWSKRRSRGGNFGPRKMFQGDWTCADCGAKITELPFEPKPDQPIRCRECWMKTKNQ